MGHLSSFASCADGFIQRNSLTQMDLKPSISTRSRSLHECATKPFTGKAGIRGAHGRVDSFRGGTRISIGVTGGTSTFPGSYSELSVASKPKPHFALQDKTRVPIPRITTMSVPSHFTLNTGAPIPAIGLGIHSFLSPPTNQDPAD